MERNWHVKIIEKRSSDISFKSIVLGAAVMNTDTSDAKLGLSSVPSTWGGGGVRRGKK